MSQVAFAYPGTFTVTLEGPAPAAPELQDLTQPFGARGPRNPPRLQHSEAQL